MMESCARCQKNPSAIEYGRRWLCVNCFEIELKRDMDLVNKASKGKKFKQGSLNKMHKAIVGQP